MSHGENHVFGINTKNAFTGNIKTILCFQKSEDEFLFLNVIYFFKKSEDEFLFLKCLYIFSKKVKMGFYF